MYMLCRRCRNYQQTWGIGVLETTVACLGSRKLGMLETGLKNKQEDSLNTASITGCSHRSYPRFYTTLANFGARFRPRSHKKQNQFIEFQRRIHDFPLVAERVEIRWVWLQYLQVPHPAASGPVSHTVRPRAEDVPGIT